MEKEIERDYVDRFLKGEIDYNSFVQEIGKNSTLWQDFLYSMFCQGILKDTTYSDTEIGGFIDGLSDLDSGLYNNTSWSNKKFFEDDIANVYWNESVHDLRKHFSTFYNEYIKEYYPREEEYDFRLDYIEKLKKLNAGFNFDQNEPWVKPEKNIDKESYSEVRGVDKILSVLANNKNLQFTADSEKDNFIIRLLMPMYSRRVEVEDLDRNFWVISEALSTIIKLVTETDSPLILLIRDLIKEVAEGWQNIYYLWAAIAAVEDKFEQLENDIKKLEVGTQKTPLNICLHFPVEDDIPARQSWLRLFPRPETAGFTTTLYDINRQITKFELMDVYYFGSERTAPEWIKDAKILLRNYKLNWIYENEADGTLIYSQGGKYYPAYNGQGIALPGTEKFFLKDFNEIKDIVNSERPVKVTNEEHFNFAVKAPNLGAIAWAKVTYKTIINNKEKITTEPFYTAYDIGHPFVNTAKLDLKPTDSEATVKLKIQEVNKAIWDTLAYADYDPQGKTVELVQNKILFENLPWVEEIGEGGVTVRTSNEIDLGHKVNKFANLIYDRTSSTADKRDMAQIIRDVAAFNYVYRFKNNGTDFSPVKIWDFIAHDIAIKPEPVQYFCDFLYYLSQEITANRFQAKSTAGQQLQNEGEGLVKIIKFLGISPSNNYSNYNLLLDWPKMHNIKEYFPQFSNTTADDEKRIAVALKILHEIYALFGFNYADCWEDWNKKAIKDRTIDGPDTTYSNDINENFIQLFGYSFYKLLFSDTENDLPDISNTENDLSDIDEEALKKDLLEYIKTDLAQGWLYKYQKCTSNPFLNMRELESWSGKYFTNKDCKFHSLKSTYSLTTSGNPILVEIIATGTNKTLSCFIDDHYKKDNGKTPILSKNSNYNWEKTCVPMVNRYMEYVSQSGLQGPHIEMALVQAKNTEEIITLETPNPTHLYQAMSDHGMIGGFSILAEDEYPQVKKDYLSSYIQPDFGEIKNYDFRFVDNPTNYCGDYSNNIINYTIRYINTSDITNNKNLTNHMNCYNCSLNIPYNLQYTHYRFNRLTDIFSVGVPVASATNFDITDTINKNVYKINHDKGYIYRMINWDKEKLGIADGIFGVHSAVIDLNTDTTQTQSPYMNDIPGEDEVDNQVLAFDIKHYQDNLNNIIKQIRDSVEDDNAESELDIGLTWKNLLTSAFPDFYDQVYINADSPENFVEADKQFRSTNILSPTLAYSGDNGGTENLMDMYISTVLPSLPYYRMDETPKYGTSYAGYTTMGIKNYKPLENYHQTINSVLIKNQEYTNFNDIYLRDILPNVDSLIRPKINVDISVFSDLSTVFELKFLKDEHKILFPGLKKTTTIPISNNFTDGNFNFIKIGNYAYSTVDNSIITNINNPNDQLLDISQQVVQDNFSYVADDRSNRSKTSYIYNFKFRTYEEKRINQLKQYSLVTSPQWGDDTNEESSKLNLFKIVNNKIQLISKKTFTEKDIIETGASVLKHFISINCDSFYSNISEDQRSNFINYFITAVGRQPRSYTNSQQCYWQSSSLCHIFVTIPSQLILNTDEIDNLIINITENDIKNSFGKEPEAIAEVNNKKVYIVCLNNLNLTEGYFLFDTGEKEKNLSQIADPAGYYKSGNKDVYDSRWRGPFINLLKDSDSSQIKITGTVKKTEYAGGTKIELNDIELLVPEYVDITCGMYDYRLRQIKKINNVNLTPEQYTVIKGDYKFYLKDRSEEEILEPKENFYFQSREKDNNEYMTSNINDAKYDKTTPLSKIFGKDATPEAIQDYPITRAIFTDGMKMGYSQDIE